jgi:hypothetical protein
MDNLDYEFDAVDMYLFEELAKVKPKDRKAIKKEAKLALDAEATERENDELS